MDMLRVFLKYQMKIPVSILPIRLFGNAVISIVLIKANIQLYFLLLKM